MKRIAILFAAIVALSAFGFAQAQTTATDDAIATALSALPANLREQAAVIKWKPDFTYDTLKKGTSRLVCYDRSGYPEQQPFSIECTSVGNLEREAQNMKYEALGDREKTQNALDAMEKAGTRIKPEFGSVWYHLAGVDKAHARMHMTIALPGATAATTGIPDNPKEGGIWIMNAGTSTAHIMTPGE